jgi:alpha-galactosidase
MMIKIAVIGAGSLTFTRSLIRDILSVKEFADIKISFNDINERNLEAVRALVQKDIDANGLNIKVFSSTDRIQCLKDCDYVINLARVGGLEAFRDDIEIPLRYGIDQCVGDTICAGGIMYGQRGIAFMLDLCTDIKKHCKDNVMLLNYGNPNAMLTWTAIKHGGVNTIGLCHGVVHGHEIIASLYGAKREDVDIVCAGINHMTWYISVKMNGRELTGELLEKFEAHPEYSKTEKCRIDVLRNFGYFSTESNGHLSEYLPWYRKRPEEIMNYIDMSSWILGETGGYYRCCYEARDWFERDIPEEFKKPALEYGEDKRGSEHFSYILEGIHTGRMYRGHFNVINNGVISNLSSDAIVEVPCYADGNGISVPHVGELPPGCAACCETNISVQRLAVAAAVKGDIVLLRQAMLLDPLNGAVCNPAEIRQMTDEMLIAGEKLLPQYKAEINLAKQRLEKSKADGKFIQPKNIYTGNMLGNSPLREN